MSDVLFEKLVAEMAGYADWILQVCVHGAGEPMLDKKLVCRIARLKDVGIRRVVTNTNGSLLSAEWSRGLLEAGLDQLGVSVDTLDPQRFARRRVGLDLEDVIANTMRFLEIRDRLRADAVLKVCMTVGDDNQDEVQAFRAFWKSRIGPGDRIDIRPLHNFGNQLEGIEPVPPEHWHVNPCSSVWSTMMLNADGQVPLCCLDFDAKVRMGSVLHSSIAEVWRGTMFAWARKLHSDGERNDIALCRGCRMWDIEGVDDRPTHRPEPPRPAVSPDASGQRT